MIAVVRVEFDHPDDGERRYAFVRVDYTGDAAPVMVEASPVSREMTFQIEKMQTRIERDYPGITPALEWYGYTVRPRSPLGPYRTHEEVTG